MIINDRILLVHIPKTGGTSIRRALKHLDTRAPKSIKSRIARRLGIQLNWKSALFRDHDPLEKIHALGSGIDALTIAVVRNPYDHAVSHYRHLQTQNGNRKYAQLAVDKSLAEFLRWRATPATCLTWLRNKNLDFAKLAGQATFLSRDGKLAVDHVLKLESLNADFQSLCESLQLGEIDLPMVNVNTTAAHVDLDQESINLINQIYDRDFEAFGYDRLVV